MVFWQGQIPCFACAVAMISYRGSKGNRFVLHGMVVVAVR